MSGARRGLVGRREAGSGLGLSHGSPSFFSLNRGRSGRGLHLAMVGFPYDLGNVVAAGSREAPQRLREASVSCEPPRAEARDWGDVEIPSGEDPEVTHGRLVEAVSAVLEKDGLPLIVGGDHSTSYPVIERLRREGDLTVLWLDAHTDFSPWHGGGAHDHKQVLRRVAGLDGVRRVVQAGYRGYTLEAELDLSDRVKVVPSRRLRQEGPVAVLDLLPPDVACYLSLDIDVVDPAYAPATSTPVPGGLTPAEVEAVLAEVCGARAVRGMDLVEINPSRDLGGRTCAMACELLHDFLEHWFAALQTPKERGPPSPRAWRASTRLWDQ